MARPRTPGLTRGVTCKNGHDEWSRTQGKWRCKACNRNNMDRYRVMDEEDEMKPRLPVDKLVSEVERRLDTGRAIRRATGGSVHAGPASERELFGAQGGRDSAAFLKWRRAKYRGYITLDALDDLCVYLDCHPREIYGDAYDEAAAPGGILEPDFYRTHWVDRRTVRAVRVFLTQTDEDPWWWHVGRRQGLQRATRRY